MTYGIHIFIEGRRKVSENKTVPETVYFHVDTSGDTAPFREIENNGRYIAECTISAINKIAGMGDEKILQLAPNEDALKTMYHNRQAARDFLDRVEILETFRIDVVKAYTLE